MGGLLGTSAVASAEVGDIDSLTVDNVLEIESGTAPGTGQNRQAVLVEGTIACDDDEGTATNEQIDNLEYGLWIKVEQPPTTDGDEGDVFGDEDGGVAEAVGAFGPNFAPPAGISDNQPCDDDGTRYDALTFRNEDSELFVEGSADAFVAAGTSAENGDRGPGPFIGDLEYIEDQAVTLEDEDGQDAGPGGA